jgi:arylsulfatase A-like enzyme
MRLVSKEPWFDDTIFLLFGDHGTGARHGLPDAQAKLVRHHVPCILYAPKFFPEPRVIDRVASSLDILPTVADLLGVPHVNQTLGRSLFDERSPRYAYLDEGWHSGLLDDEFYLMRTEHESRLYRYRVDVTTDWSSADPERKARMERLCRGLHETSRYLLYHNRPPK